MYHNLPLRRWECSCRGRHHRRSHSRSFEQACTCLTGTDGCYFPSQVKELSGSTTPLDILGCSIKNELGSISQKVHEIAQKFQRHRVPVTFFYWIGHTFGRSNSKNRKWEDFPHGRTCRRCQPMKCRTFKVQPQRSNLPDIQKPGHHSIENYLSFLMMYQKFLKTVKSRK